MLSVKNPLTPIRSLIWTATFSLLISGCAGPTTVGLSPGHVVEDEPQELVAPATAFKRAPEPEPVPLTPEPRYTIVVKEVPVIDLLFSLARDAGLDLDLQSTRNKTVTLNAVDRPLGEILDRVSTMAELRFRLRGSNLIVEDDVAYWNNYHVDYVNITRNSVGEVGVATQIATSGGTVGEDTGQAGDNQGNLSKTTVKSTSNNDFWSALEAGLEAIIKNTKPVQGTTSPQDNDPVIVNTMSGIVTVLGNQRQQHRIQAYLDSVVANAQRQVLIEMTIVEVELSDNFQAGVDWQRLSDNAGLGNNGASLESSMLGANLSVPPFFTVGYNDDDPNGGNVSATVSMLQEFGDTKVLSSPR